LKAIKLVVLCLLISQVVVFAKTKIYYVTLTEPIISSGQTAQSSSIKASVGAVTIDTSLIKKLSHFTTFNLLDKDKVSTGSAIVKGGVQTARKYKKKYVYKLHINENNADSVEASLKKIPSFQYFQPNYTYYPQLLGNATSSSKYDTQKQYMDYMKFPLVWEYATGNNVVVAVMDSGINKSHFEFCDSDNSDCPAADFSIVTPQSFPVEELLGSAAASYVGETYNNPLVYEDLNGHGTHVAGIIGAQFNSNKTDNGASHGIVGAAYGVKLMPLKVFFMYSFEKNELRSQTDSLVSAINYAVKNNAHIINMSLGGILNSDEDKLLEDAVNQAVQADVLIVAASGNDFGLNIYTNRIAPAYFNNTLSVNAVDYDGNLEYYSNSGGDISAYGGCHKLCGRGVYSSWISANDKYVFTEGTSMASPFVAALGALIQSYYMQQNNGDKMSPADLIELITKSAYRSTSEVSSETGYGVVDAQKAFFYLGAMTASSTMNTVVFDGSDGNHSELLCYPNPLYLKDLSETNCVFFTTESGTYDFRVYSRRGELVYSKRNQPMIFGKNTIPWSGRNDYSQAISNGVYQVLLHIKYDDTTQKPLIKKHLVTVFN
jgi:subtilisin family serine protease